MGMLELTMEASLSLSDGVAVWAEAGWESFRSRFH
jgi:hypothetical protein